MAVKDVVVYVLVQTSVTAGDIKESVMFQHLHIKGVRSWRDIWNTEPFQKIGRLSHMHPTYQWLEDVHDHSREGLAYFVEVSQIKE